MNHSDEAATDVAFTRIFDDGGRMILPGEEGDEADAGLIALDTASCTGSQCPCHEVDLLAQPLALVGGKVVETEDPPLHATLDVESGEIFVENEPDPGTPQALLLERLRRQLRGDRLEALHERWRRARLQDEPNEWKETDWSGVDLEAMVPFLELFPSRWDLSVVLDGRRYWVIDLWCLIPDCPCTEVSLDFLAADDESAEHLFVDLETGQPDDPDATETAHRLWNALTGDADALAELRTRREDARRVARELPEYLAPPKPVVADPRAGRNDPCPCGSGKKFKRCCGA